MEIKQYQDKICEMVRSINNLNFLIRIFSFVQVKFKKEKK